jgi:FkbM family methyltransferase
MLITKIVSGISQKFNKQNVKPNFKRISWFKTKLLKHQDDISIKKIKLHDFSFFYKRPYEVLHTYEDLFINEIYKFEDSKKANPLIIDCGSNIGLSIIYFKKLFQDAQIIAFEADPNNYSILNQNITSNNLTNITLYEKAVWISNGLISFDSSGSEDSHISIVENEKESKGMEVEAIDFSSFLEEYPEIDFLKMDIEGAEYPVLKKSASQLKKIKKMFIEYHGKVDDIFKLYELLEIFRANGFMVYIKNAADNLPTPFVKKRTGYLYDIQLNIFCYK